jgi:hypothetical protein
MLENGEQPDAVPVRATLEVCLPDIQRILHSGIPAKDFTLHDENHSFRVAERMVEVIPAAVPPRLSGRELGLLLLSAYLHDIGMAPDQGLVDRHYAYLLTNGSNLSDREHEDFRRWLDDHGRGRNLPLDTSSLTSAQLVLARELVSHYCRFRHNDWSADYIRRTLSSTKPGLYEGWLDDLVVLCRSHHEGIDELRLSRFDPRDAGSPPTTIHLRYLSCVLRLADVLEIDPERTPEVLIRSRDIATASLPYWRKDQQISVRITTARDVLLTARPTSAYLHRAAEETAWQIEEELRTCRTLADTTNFLRHPHLPEQLPHEWDLPASLTIDILPRSGPQDGGYEYINGALRPETERLLEILSGTELYESPLVAVRELLQNAFDAVRIQMALERLRAPDPLDISLVKHLSGLHEVELRLETRSDGAWLICCDTGVGMAKYDIENRLLVSGKPTGSDLKSLERRCRQAGFKLDRSGQFGIGFLSYFMISDHVVMHTRRSSEGGDTDGSGWTFSIGGVGQFGELRRDNEISGGTKVSLRLIEDALATGSGKLAEVIHNYLFKTIMRCPCRFHFVAAMDSGRSFARADGWVKQESELNADMMAFLDREIARPDPSAPALQGLLPSALQEELGARRQEQESFRNELQASIRWSLIEGRLPSDFGSYRVQIPYFALEHGSSLAFLRLMKLGQHLSLKPSGRGHFFVPRGEITVGWRGMISPYTALFHFRRPELQQYSNLSARIEIDFDDPVAAQVSANRWAVSLSPNGVGSVQWSKDEAHRLHRSFLEENHNPVYASVGSRVGSHMIADVVPKYWLAEEQSEEAPGEMPRWQPLTFPLIASSNPFDSKNLKSLRFRDQPVYGAPELKPAYYGGALYWHSRWLAPDRVVLRASQTVPRLEALWIESPTSFRPLHQAGLLTSFPPNWLKVVGGCRQHYSAPGEHVFLWNIEHAVVNQVDESGWQRCKDSFAQGLDPLLQRAGLLSQRSFAASWLLKCLVTNAEILWNGLIEKEAAFLVDLWAGIFGPGAPDELVYLPNLSLCTKIFLVSPRQWTVVTNYQEQKSHLPDPPADWRLDGPIKPAKKRDRSKNRAPKT